MQEYETTKCNKRNGEVLGVTTTIWMVEGETGLTNGGT